MPRMARTLADPPDWFWSKVAVGGPHDCWPARGGSVGHQGHRLIRVNGRALGAHVIAWCLAHQRMEQPTGWVLHRCDNPPCCNPAHLYEGDVRDNVRDMVARGRHRNQVKTHCDNGHELTPENTYAPPSRPGTRRCRTCQRIGNQQSEQRKSPEEREAAKARRAPYPCPVCGQVRNYGSMRRHIRTMHGDDATPNGSPGATHCAGLGERAGIPVRRWTAP